MNIESKINVVKYSKLKECTFRIPIYQRRYAWKAEEVGRLLTDIEEWKNKDYFIGNIVVEKLPDNTFDVIDGQQRLTTLYLLAACLGKKDIFTLKYDVREKDDAFLQALKSNNEKSLDELIKQYNPDPVFGANYEAIERFENKEELLDKIECVLTELDADEVDVAKYFEVMNSRGKQLEKHQILKAKFLEGMDYDDQITYAKLWDYCSRMDVYLEDFIYRYEKRDAKGKYTIEAQKLRYDLLKIAFSDEQSEQCNINEFFKNSKGQDQKSNKISILEALIDDGGTGETEKKGVDRYRSILKFEYFLLHILKLINTSNTNDIVINDSKLIEQFDKARLYGDNIDVETKKGFLCNLFKYRILYDYFFFRRYEGDDEPFFALLGKNEDKIDIDRTMPANSLAHQIMNIQLLFNFTTDFFAQNWIFPVLKWIKGKYKLEEIDDFYDEYKDFLEKLDSATMIERLKKGTDLKNLFYTFVHNEELKADSDQIKNLVGNLAQVELHKGTSTQHYWFYKLDYLLWREYKWEEVNFDDGFEEKEKFKYTEIKTNFRLSRLNSIEHIKPQSHSLDWDSLSQNCELCQAETKVDCFGNLALISAHMNSSLLNHEENKKTKIQEQLNRGTIESLKMLLAYSQIKSSTEWTCENCEEHQAEMIKILKESLK